MSTLVLLRHAEPEESSRGRCYGRLDVGLSRTGHAQAGRLAGELADLPVDAVYTSPRRRAVDTAAALGRGSVVEERLRELDFGDFEGRTYDEIALESPETYRAWMETPTRVRFPGGECFADLRVRALAACEEIRSRHECAVVVTHGGVVRAALAAWLSMPDEAIFRLDVRYGGLTIVDWFDEVPVVRLVNG